MSSTAIFAEPARVDRAVDVVPADLLQRPLRRVAGIGRLAARLARPVELRARDVRVGLVARERRVGVALRDVDDVQAAARAIALRLGAAVARDDRVCSRRRPEASFTISDDCGPPIETVRFVDASCAPPRPLAVIWYVPTVLVGCVYVNAPARSAEAVALVVAPVGSEIWSVASQRREKPLPSTVRVPFV